MARKSHRASRTKSRKHSKRQRSQRQRSQRRTRRHQGGAYALTGAPLSDSLAGGWSSKISIGQGGDYLKYHAGQFGGALEGAPVSVIGGEGLPASMQGSAMTASTMKAYAEIAGLKDQHGGRRKKRAKKSKKQRRTRSKRSNRQRSNRSKRQRGGSKLEFAPISTPGMLLSDYSKTGLSPQWNGGVEFSAAAARQAM